MAVELTPEIITLEVRTRGMWRLRVLGWIVPLLWEIAPASAVWLLRLVVPTIGFDVRAPGEPWQRQQLTREDVGL